MTSNDPSNKIFRAVFFEKWSFFTLDAKHKSHDLIIFQNKMHIPPFMINNLIFTADPILWSFTCSYPTSYDISFDGKSNFIMDTAGQSASFQSRGSFELDLRNVYLSI